MEIRIRKRSDCSDADPIDITEYWRRAAQREIEMGRAMATAGCAPRASRLGAADSYGGSAEPSPLSPLFNRSFIAPPSPPSFRARFAALCCFPRAGARAERGSGVGERKGVEPMLEEQRQITIRPRDGKHGAHSRNARKDERKEESESRGLFRMRKRGRRQKRGEKKERGSQGEKEEERGSLNSCSSSGWVYDALLHPVWPEPETTEDRMGDNAAKD